MRIEQEHITGLRRLGDETPMGRVEVGPQEPYFAPLNKVNLLSQIRQNIDSEQLLELTKSLIFYKESNEPYIGLIQPITLGLFKAKDLEMYLDRLNRMWNSHHDLSQLTPLTEGTDNYLIAIAGHRRTLALTQAAQIIGVDPNDIDVEFHLKHGDRLTFRESVTTQYRENFHNRVESWEDALAISAILREGRESGDYTSFADCARDLAVDTDRVSRAFRFQTLPRSVQQMTEHGTLNYGRSLLLADLFAVLGYKEVEDNISDDKKKEYQSRLRQNRLYITDFIEDLTPEQYVRYMDSCLMHAVKVAGLLSQSKARQYTDKLIYSLLNEGQLTLVAYEESELSRAQTTRNRKEARDSAVAALKSLVAIVISDGERIDYGSVPILARSPRVTGQLRALHAGIGALATFSKSSPVDEVANQQAIQEGVSAAEELIYELEDWSNASCEPEILTEALARIHAAGDC